MREVRLLLARHRRPLALVLVLAGLWITVRSAAPAPSATVTLLTAARDLPAGHTLTDNDLRAANWPADRAPLGRLEPAAGRMLASPIRSGEPVTDARVLGPGLLTGQPSGLVAVPVRLGDAAAGLIVRAGDRVDVLASSPSSTVSSDWSAEPDPAEADRAEPDPADGTGSNGSTGSTGAAGSTGRESGTERVAVGALVLAAPGSAANGGTGWAGSTGSGLSGLGGGFTGATMPGSASSSAADPAGLVVLAVPSLVADKLAAAQAGRYLGIAVLPTP